MSPLLALSTSYGTRDSERSDGGSDQTEELGFGGLSGYIPRYVQRLPAYIEKASPSWMPSIPTAVVVGEVLYRATRCTSS